MKCSLDSLEMEFVSRNMFEPSNIIKNGNTYFYKMMLPIHYNNRYWLNMFENVKVLKEEGSDIYNWIKITI